MACCQTMQVLVCGISTERGFNQESNGGNNSVCIGALQNCILIFVPLNVGTHATEYIEY